jgi:hypothetical protein
MGHILANFPVASWRLLARWRDFMRGRDTFGHGRRLAGKSFPCSANGEDSGDWRKFFEQEATEATERKYRPLFTLFSSVQDPGGWAAAQGCPKQAGSQRTLSMLAICPSTFCFRCPEFVWWGKPAYVTTLLASGGRCSRPAMNPPETRCFATTLLASVARCSRRDRDDVWF